MAFGVAGDGVPVVFIGTPTDAVFNLFELLFGADLASTGLAPSPQPVVAAATANAHVIVANRLRITRLRQLGNVRLFEGNDVAVLGTGEACIRTEWNRTADRANRTIHEYGVDAAARMRATGETRAEATTA